MRLYQKYELPKLALSLKYFRRYVDVPSTQPISGQVASHSQHCAEVFTAPVMGTNPLSVDVFRMPLMPRRIRQSSDVLGIIT